MTTMTLGAITFNNGVPDANGALWYVSEWEGWDSPNLRQSFVEPTSRHGSVLSESLLGVRALSIQGICKAPTESAFWASYNRLLGVAANLKTPTTFTVQEDVLKTLYVVRSGEVRNRFKGVNAFEFEVPLSAPDPLKYGNAVGPVAIGASGSQVLTNAGTFSSWNLVVTATSSGTIDLTNNLTGQTLTTSGTSVDSGTVYDFNARTAYSGNVNRYFQLAANSQWWGLGSGANTIQNNGTAPVSITYRSAWV